MRGICSLPGAEDSSGQGWAGGSTAAVAHGSGGKGDPLGDRLKTKAGATLSQPRKLSERARWSENSTGRQLERDVGPAHWETLGVTLPL